MSKELLFSVTLKDCDVETFRSGGPGGQNQNKRDTGVRVRHRASGAVGESREERSQLQNKKLAFQKMAKDPRFTYWVREEQKRRETGKTAEERVDEMMAPENLKFEVKVDGKWTDDLD